VLIIFAITSVVIGKLADHVNLWHDCGRFYTQQGDLAWNQANTVTIAILTRVVW